MPIIVLLSLGIIEYGWMFYKSYEIENAARVGARQAAMPSGNSTTVLATVDALLAKANIPAAYVISRTVEEVPLHLVPDEPPETGMRVTIDVAYRNGLWLTTAPLLPVPTKLHASVTMNQEGF